MSFREIVGLVLLLVGVAIVPLGWMIDHRLLLLSFALMFVGCWLFYTQRQLRKEEELAKEQSWSRRSGPDVPGDIHNYTGWRTGGRTETLGDSLDSNSSDGD